jgi:putative transposase
MSADYSIEELAEALQLSRSGYYAWLKRRADPGPRARANQILVAHIRALHQQHRQRYGSPRIWQSLRQQGQRCGRHRVARLMKAHGLRAKQKRAFRPRTTVAGSKAAPNLLMQTPAPSGPDQVWVADITYVQTREGWLYLAAVMDLYSRRIVGWQATEHLDAALVEAAMRQALRSRRPPPGLLHHSDRGYQYTSAAYQQLLSSANVVVSMSRPRDCYDNATMEAFWSSLKGELVHGADFSSRQQARAALFEYLEIYYNRKRLHSALQYQSPETFERGAVPNR